MFSNFIYFHTFVKRNLEKTSEGEATNLFKLNRTKTVGLRKIQFCNLPSKVIFTLATISFFA